MQASSIIHANALFGAMFPPALPFKVHMYISATFLFLYQSVNGSVVSLIVHQLGQG